MSTSYGRQQEVSHQIDIEARRRITDSEYTISRLEEERSDLNAILREDPNMS